MPPQETDKQPETNTTPDNPVMPEPNTTPAAPFSPPKKSPLKLVLIILAIIVVLGGAVFAYLQMNKEASDNSQATDTPAQTEADAEAKNVPRILVYANNENTLKGTKLFWKNIGGESETVAKDFGAEHYVQQLSVWQTKVSATVSSPEGDQVWYSSDEGKTYTKAFQSAPIKQGSTFGDQITRTIFSNDGEGLVVALITADGVYKVVYQPLVDGNAADLFVSNKPMILKGYDVKAGKVYYLKTVCWNCDGGLVNEFFTYDLNTKQESSWKNPNNLINDVALNSDFSKALVITGPQNPEGPGLIYPFKIHELDLSTGNANQLLEDPDSFINAGYGLDDKAYYTAEGKLTNIGNSAPSFESADTISSVLFAYGDEIVTLTSKEYSMQKVIHFVKSTQALSTIYDAKSYSIVGVSVVTYRL